MNLLKNCHASIWHGLYVNGLVSYIAESVSAKWFVCSVIKDMRVFIRG